MPSRCPYERIAEDLISACRKHAVAATGPSPFKVRDNQRPERTMTGVRKPPPESYVPGDNLTRGSRRNQLRRGHGSPPVLSEVPHELSIPMRTPKSANGPRSNSFRPDSPLHNQLPTGTEDSVNCPLCPLTTPDMVRSGRVFQTSVKFPISAFKYLTLSNNPLYLIISSI